MSQMHGSPLLLAFSPSISIAITIYLASSIAGKCKSQTTLYERKRTWLVLACPAYYSTQNEIKWWYLSSISVRGMKLLPCCSPIMKFDWKQPTNTRKVTTKGIPPQTSMGNPSSTQSWNHRAYRSLEILHAGSAVIWRETVQNGAIFFWVELQVLKRKGRHIARIYRPVWTSRDEIRSAHEQEETHF